MGFVIRWAITKGKGEEKMNKHWSNDMIDRGIKELNRFTAPENHGATLLRVLEAMKTPDERVTFKRSLTPCCNAPYEIRLHQEGYWCMECKQRVVASKDDWEKLTDDPIKEFWDKWDGRTKLTTIEQMQFLDDMTSAVESHMKKHYGVG